MYDIFKNFETPSTEDIEILQKIIDLSANLNDQDNVAYFTEEINLVKNKYHSRAKEIPKSNRPMADVKEIWIFSNIGITIFTYAPETAMDDDLLGGFLCAALQFSVEFSNREFDSVVIENDRYIVYQEEGRNLYLFGRAS